MLKAIDRPASCEIRAVIKFSNERNVQPFEIYSQISESHSGPSSIRLPFVFSFQEISCRPAIYPHKHSITGWQVTLSAFLLLVPQLFGKNEICPPQPLQPRCFRKLFFSGEANDHPTPVTGH
ncbi:hypothetical protein AVEN_144879-1 [Araneus ventricosus]|uniref:Uncharacterized protein n=2 Tax=Araneus ventricosus TaxID=182803 RepID=A0A4Y2EGW8_ARAVE|nr:hypothetical protein AVEN_144879-1 [Araneus ventricosus]